MNLVSRLFGGGPTDLTKGNHNISRTDALAQTTADAISPVKPPNWGNTNVRTLPIVPKYRPFTWAEAEAMHTRAIQRQTESNNWHRVMESAEKMEKLDAKDHGRFRKYQGVLATTEADKLQANSDLSQGLHALRPKYASMSHGMESAEIQASRDITELKNKYVALMY